MIAAVELYRPRVASVRSRYRSSILDRSFVRATPVRPRDDDAEEEARSTIERRAR